MIRDCLSYYKVPGHGATSGVVNSRDCGIFRLCSILARLFSCQNSKRHKAFIFLSLISFSGWGRGLGAGPMKKFCATEKPPTGDRLAVVLVFDAAAIDFPTDPQGVHERGNNSFILKRGEWCGNGSRGLCRKGAVMMIIMRIYQANPIDGAVSMKSQNRGLCTHTIISP
jgi:hypothetical protein